MTDLLVTLILLVPLPFTVLIMWLKFGHDDAKFERQQAIKRAGEEAVRDHELLMLAQPVPPAPPLRRMLVTALCERISPPPPPEPKKCERAHYPRSYY